MRTITVTSAAQATQERVDLSAYLHGLPEGAQLMVGATYYEKQDAEWNDWLQLGTGRPYEDSIITDSAFVHLCHSAQSVIVPLERQP